jgi:hypothetical protein
MTFNACQSFYSNICELSPWWLEVSACLAADKVTYDYIWLNNLVLVPAGTSGRNFFPVPVGSGSGRNLKNWFRCTPSCIKPSHYVCDLSIIAIKSWKSITAWSHALICCITLSYLGYNILKLRQIISAILWLQTLSPVHWINVDFGEKNC